MPVLKSKSAALVAESESLLAQRRIPEALSSFDQAQAAGSDPDRCAAGRWVAYMLLGQFEQAWQESDSIRARGMSDVEQFWKGEDITGKRVIVRCLHGYGDAVQFLRYAPLLRARASHLIVEVPPRFTELAKSFDEINEIITWGDNAPAQQPVWDVQVEVMELPYIFRTHPGELPLFANYLHLPPAAHPERVSRASLKVGLAWTAGAWNPARSLSIEILQPLLSIAGCEFWNLSEGSQDVSSGEAVTSLQVDERCRDSIEGLAALISELDLVITVDTLAAHLAAALGVKTWVLLPFAADWRWMHGRSDSPWYPAMHLFRQPSPGDWRSVIESARLALQRTASCEFDHKVA